MERDIHTVYNWKYEKICVTLRTGDTDKRNRKGLNYKYHEIFLRQRSWHVLLFSRETEPFRRNGRSWRRRTFARQPSHKERARIHPLECIAAEQKELVANAVRTDTNCFGEGSHINSVQGLPWTLDADDDPQHPCCFVAAAWLKIPLPIYSSDHRSCAGLRSSTCGAQ